MRALGSFGGEKAFSCRAIVAYNKMALLSEKSFNEIYSAERFLNFYLLPRSLRGQPDGQHSLVHFVFALSANIFAFPE